MKIRIMRYIILCLLILIAVQPVHGVPTITSSTNNLSSNNYPVVDYECHILFEITTDEAITLYQWYTDDVNQSNNVENLTESWDEKGYKNVTVYATNANGTASHTWNPYVKTEMATAVDEVVPVPTDGYDELMDELGSSDPDFETVLHSTTMPYTAVMGNMFFVVLWGLPMVMLWIRQESMLLPSVWGLVFGSLFLAFMPTSFAATASAMIVLSVMGILYVFYKERR